MAEHDGTLDNVINFVDCMHTRKSPNANIHVGFEAARASWIGNIALKRGMKVAWDADERQGSVMVSVFPSAAMANCLAGLLLLAVLAGLPLRAEEPTPARAFYNTFTDDEEMALGRQGGGGNRKATANPH